MLNMAENHEPNKKRKYKMVYGLKKWNDKNTYYTQINNPTEEILRKKNIKNFLETCGPTSAINILAARGDNLLIKCPGEYIPQPEEVLTDYFNDPANYKRLETARKGLSLNDWLGNEIPQYYTIAIPAVFNVNAKFCWSQTWQDIIDNLKINIGVMLCLKKPGHYIAVIAYDENADEMIYNDPWPGNKWPDRYTGMSGFNRRMKKTEYHGNVKAFCVEIG